MLTAKGGVEKDAGRAHQCVARVKDTLQGYETGAVEFLAKPVQVTKWGTRRFRQMVPDHDRRACADSHTYSHSNPDSCNQGRIHVRLCQRGFARDHFGLSSFPPGGASGG